MSGAPSTRALRCTSCGAEIPVRTFKAGRITCPHCGAERGLDTDLVDRLRAEAQEASAASTGASSMPDPAPDPDARARVHPAYIALAAVLLGLTAYLLYVW